MFTTIVYETDVTMHLHKPKNHGSGNCVSDFCVSEGPPVYWYDLIVTRTELIASRTLCSKVPIKKHQLSQLGQCSRAGYNDAIIVYIIHI